MAIKQPQEPKERPEPPKRPPLILVDQKPGSRSVIVAEARDIFITQLYHHPKLLFAVLLLAIFATLIAFAVGTSIVGVRVRFLETLVGVVCRVAGLPTPSPTSTGSFPTVLPLASVTPGATITPIPIGGLATSATEVIALDEPKLCTVKVDTLRIRGGPGTTYDVIGRSHQNDRLAPLGRNEDGTWLSVQLETTDRIGWVSADSANVSCNVPVQSFPVAAVPTLPPVALVPTTVPTRRPTATTIPVAPANTATPVPPPPPVDPLLGSWSGTTDQGEKITFEVEPDAVGFAAVNLSAPFQFEPSCPIGRVTFTSLNAAHIFGPPGLSFSFLGLTEPQSRASLQGGISGSTASGSLTVTDTRSPEERSARNCAFSTTIKWTATKQ
jgi:hypothetical protein